MTPAPCAGEIRAVEPSVFDTKMFRILLWTFAMALFYVAVPIPMPGGEQGTLSVFDKATHVFAYGFLTLLGLAGRYAATPLAMSLLLHGTLLEVCQGLFTTYRTASLADWLADGMGIAVALLLAGLGRFLLARLGRKARSSRIAT